MAGAAGRKVLALAVVLAAAVGAIAWRLAGARLRSVPVELPASDVPSPPESGNLSTPEGNAEEPSDGGRSVEATTETPTASRPASSLRPIVVVGRVTDRDGKPIVSPRSNLRVTDSHGFVRLAPIRGGEFAIDGCAAGSLDLGCEAAGFKPLARTIALRDGEREHREDFALEPGWIVAVRIVTTDGRRIWDPTLRREVQPGVILSLEARAPGESTSAGTFVVRPGSEWFPGGFVEDSDGLLDIFADPPVEVVARLGASVLATKLVQTRVDRLTLELPVDALGSRTCEFVGHVVDAATLAPVMGARVQRGQEPELTTDAAGEFRAKKLLPGKRTLTILATRYAHETRRVELLPGQVTDVGTIALQAPVSLQGRFIDASGLPARADAELCVYDEEHPFDDILSTSKLKMRGSEDGRFESLNCGRRRYLLVAMPPPSFGRSGPDWRAQPVLVDLTRGPVHDLVVRVEPGVEVLLRPDSEAVRDLGYWITSADSLPASHGSFARSGVVRERLAPGKYTLLLGRGDTVVRKIPFSVGQEPLTLDLGP